MKCLNGVFLVFCVMLSAKGYGVGIDSKKLKLECTGEVSLNSVKRVGVIGGFEDRAGNWHPGRGIAYLESSISSLSENCAKMEEKLEIDLDSKTFEHYFSFGTTDKKKIMELASLKIGEVHSFKANQNFSFQDKDGYLPFFPLIHSEYVSLKSSSISLPGASFKVNANKVYDNFLQENDKVSLSKLVFQYIEKPDYNGLYMPSVVNAMFENHPTFEANFEVFLDKVLAYYQKLEISMGVDSTIGLTNWMLSTISSNIRELTHQYPEVYAFDIPNLLLNHPSLVNYSKWNYSKATCPKVSAIQLEKTLEFLSQKLDSGSLNKNIIAKWKDPLKVIAGHLWSAGINPCLSNISSTLSEITAKNLLKNHY